VDAPPLGRSYDKRVNQRGCVPVNSPLRAREGDCNASPGMGLLLQALHAKRLFLAATAIE
jgi:hypothetical protein